MQKMNSVVHFEMPAHDSKRMADFYAGVFGWQPHFFGPDMGNYVTVATTESDENNRPKTPGAINGGFYMRRPDVADDCPSIVISVDDIHASTDKIVSSGGKMLGVPMLIPGVGHYVSFLDTEGNRSSLLQPLMG